MVSVSESAQRFQIASSILKYQGITFDTLEPLSGGFINSVFRVDEKFVLRFQRSNSERSRLKLECELVMALPDTIPVANLVVYGDFENHTYQLWQYVKGVLLADAWCEFNHAQRRVVIDEIIEALNALHEIKVNKFGMWCLGGPISDSWLDYLKGVFSICSQHMLSQPHCAIYGALVDEIDSQFHDLITPLQWSPQARLIHNDLHSTNIIVENGHLASILDWEIAIGGPVDLEWYKMEHFCRDPQSFGKQGDYSELWRMLTAEASDCYADDFPIKLNVYDLIGNWRSARFESENNYTSADKLLPSLVSSSQDILNGTVRRLPVKAR